MTIVAANAIYLACYHSFDALLAVGSGILRGAGRLGWGAIINVVAFSASTMLGGYVMCYQWDWGLKGIWLGYGVGVGTAFGAMMVLSYFINWKKAAAEAHVRAMEEGVPGHAHHKSPVMMEEGMVAAVNDQPMLLRARSAGHEGGREAPDLVSP